MFEFGNRRAAKQYSGYLSFIAAIRSGKTAIIFAPDYVVMDRKSYDNLCENKFRGQSLALVEYDDNSWIKERFIKP